LVDDDILAEKGTERTSKSRPLEAKELPTVNPSSNNKKSIVAPVSFNPIESSHTNPSKSKTKLNSRVNKGSRAKPAAPKATSQTSQTSSLPSNSSTPPEISDQISQTSAGPKSANQNHTIRKRPAEPKQPTDKKETFNPLEHKEDEKQDGMRRSKRQRIGRLRFWENERIVYGSQMTAAGRVPVITEVIRVPKHKPEKKKRVPARSKFKVQSSQAAIYHRLCASSPQLKESVALSVFPHRSHSKADATVAYAWPGDKLSSTHLNDLGFDYQIMGSQPGGVASSGFLEILPQEKCEFETLSLAGGAIGYVIYGHLVVTLKGSTFKLSPGCQLLVPPNTPCSLSNASRHEKVRLFIVNP
ncbi:mitotic fidelity of chromosome transmission- protein, partial [Massospora cicadina]